MVQRVSADSEGRHLAFDLDLDKGKWAAVDEHAIDRLEDADFPLVALTDKRYELFSDGTFVEVDD